ncbi:MAG: hypothetical protein M1609_02705, partial [Firmicutes bacterium]|nr:hypothetical protein [Bacillota bacterium]
LAIVRTIDPKKAAQKPETTKPLTTDLVMSSMNRAELLIRFPETAVKNFRCGWSSGRREAGIFLPLPFL